VKGKREAVAEGRFRVTSGGRQKKGQTTRGYKN